MNRVTRYLLLLLMICMALVPDRAYAQSTPSSNTNKVEMKAGLQITWLGHSCFQIRTSEGTLVLDPYKKVPGYKDISTEADAVFKSHEHDDHNFTEGVKLSGKDVKFDIRTLDVFHDNDGDNKNGNTKVTILLADGMKVVHMGDIEGMPDDAVIKEIQGADILMIPVGGHFTVDGKKALEIVEKVNPKMVIPMHFKEGDFGFNELSTKDDFLSGNLPKKEWESNSFNTNDIKFVKKGTIILLKQPKQ